MTPEYYQDYYNRNKDRIKEKTKQWAINNPEKIREYRQRYHKTDTYIMSRRNAAYKRQYGISLIEYNNILEKQSHLCAICKKEETRSNTLETDGKKHLVVDHDHVDNQVRGLLCTRCNSLLGFSLDDISILENAILYLKEHA